MGKRNGGEESERKNPAHVREKWSEMVTEKSIEEQEGSVLPEERERRKGKSNLANYQVSQKFFFFANQPKVCLYNQLLIYIINLKKHAF